MFVALKNVLAKSGLVKEERPKMWLLEFDKRFEVFEEFVFYDFNEPLKLSRESCWFSPLLCFGERGGG